MVSGNTRLITEAFGSTPLLPLLHEQAVSRSLLSSGSKLTPEDVFALVRDMPYQRASSRGPEAIVSEWRGTCSGKHYLLKSLFEDLDLDARVMMCTHLFTEQNTAHFPESLRALVSQAPIPDVHTFIRIGTSTEQMDVDATWPLYTRRLGMAVNDHFQMGINMRVACDPIETFDVPDGMDAQTFKEELIEKHCASHTERRDRFIEGMSAWLVGRIL